MSPELVQALNDRARCGLEITGIIEQGQSGAAYVRWPDGRNAVVTTAFGAMAHMRQTADVLAEVRMRGIPVPEHQFLFEIRPGTVAVVQERLPGTTVKAPDVAAVEAVVAVNDRFASLLADRPDVAPPPLSLGRPGDPSSTEPLRRHSARSRRLLRVIRRTAGAAPDVAGDDLVHVDLTVPNMLFDRDGGITGVIDWNYGVARGDRNYALVKLLHNLSHAAMTKDGNQHPTDAAVDYVGRVVEERMDPAVIRRYWAHQTVNALYGSDRWGTEQAFMTHLALGESRLL